MSEILIYNAGDLDRGEWRELQAISRDGFAATLHRTREEINALVEWNDPDRYALSHVNPNSEVGKRYAANQSYTNPRVAVAVAANQPVGFAYSAHNVSGASRAERLVKRLSVVKNYLWLREVAVTPSCQGQGIARKLGTALLQDAIPSQSPVAYIWPDEIDYMQGALAQQGFRATHERQAVIFGEGSAPVRQVRMQAASVRTVLQGT